jgi:hypothetical protein
MGTFLKVKRFYIKFGSGVDWRCGSWAPGIQSDLTHILPHVWIRGWIEDGLWLVMPVQVSACTSHPAQGYLISRSHLRCTCSPPFLQRDLADLCTGARLEAHWSRAVHVVMLLWFIHLLLFSSFFSDPQLPGLSCYAGGFAAIWQYCILHILGCIFVFYETTNQVLKFIYPFGQICKVIRMVMWIMQRNNILHDMLHLLFYIPSTKKFLGSYILPVFIVFMHWKFTFRHNK